jgi:hypothetical protein
MSIRLREETKESEPEEGISIRTQAIASLLSMSERKGSEDEYVPLVTTALEVRTDEPLLSLTPVLNSPGLDLEVLDLDAEVGHVLVRERLIYKVTSVRPRKRVGVAEEGKGEAKRDERGKSGKSYNVRSAQLCRPRAR